MFYEAKLTGFVEALQQQLTSSRSFDWHSHCVTYEPKVQTGILRYIDIFESTQDLVCCRVSNGDFVRAAASFIFC